jgi:hypothetical protein
LTTVFLAATAASTLVLERDAEACGGCFAPPETPTVVTDHRMILSVSPTQSTLYDQIRYQGDPAAFAWVLPIRGVVTVGLSADVLFQSLDNFTQITVTPPPLNCPHRPSNCDNQRGGGFANAAPSESDDPNGVNVLKKETVGPYETVQLQSTNQMALENWLTQNGFNLPNDVRPVIGQYIGEQFNFLALRLQPGASVKDMRPVRVTTPGASVALPLRMVAAGTGPVVGISLWVVGEGRYEPQNFGSFVIKDEEIAWDWAANKSNYTEIRAQKTQAGAGRVWEIESSVIVYRQTVEQIVRQGTWNGVGPVPQTDEERASQDYLPVTGPNPKTAVQVRDEDIGTLFYGIPTATSRVTRMRADLVHASLDVDLNMRAAQDQGVLQNVRRVTKELNQPQCPVFQGCDQVGTAPRDEAFSRSSSSGDGSFTCATGPVGRNAWLGAVAGLFGLAIAGALRKRLTRR